MGNVRCLIGIVLLCVCGTGRALSAESPSTAAADDFSPLDWRTVKAGDPACNRMAQATRELMEVRSALSAVLDQRIAADAAKEAPVDVLLELSEAMVSYANCQLRPTPGIAPQWRNPVGAVLGRIHSSKEDFTPSREDLRLSLGLRGGRWFGPRIGMVSSKFRQQFHLSGSALGELRAGPEGVGGEFALTSVRGDFRYDMHFSGESTTCTIPEFKQIRDYEGHSSWPDWWVGPRQRMRPWDQHFALNAAQRRGWILKATLLSPDEAAPGSPCRDAEVFVWIDDGRMLRGYFIIPGKIPGRGPEPLVALNRWSLKDNTLEAEFLAGHGSGRRNYQLRASLAEREGGALTGDYRAISPAGQTGGTTEGTLYRAYCGNYTTRGLDGTWTGEALAGIAPASHRQPELKAPAIVAATAPRDLFRIATEVYGQVAALDWALREYPLPLAEALRGIREGTDDRFSYWPPNLAWHYRATRRYLSPVASTQMHEALAAGMGADALSPARYLEALARIARANLAARQAAAALIVGIPDPADPDFGPPNGCRAMEQNASQGNVLSPSASGGAADWRVVGDWTCFGFISRYTALESVPYLPELAVERGLRSSAGALEPGRAARLAHPDAGKHLWYWRADPDPVERTVTIPRECLLPTREQRQRWGGSKGTGVSGETLDYFYHNLATWYAATTIHSDKSTRIWLAVKVDWDGRLWVNDVMVWRPARLHTPNRLAVIPVDLVAGVNRLTVCCSPRPVEDGNSGNFGAYVFKYGPKAMGSFAVYVSNGGQPRTPEAVTAAAAKEQSADSQIAAATVARSIRGPRGDGSARYPEARPAVAWDIQRNINIRWRADLPTDDAEAVIVGQRLFVTTYTGELACLDALTGKELWRKKPTVEVAADNTYPPQAITASYTMSSLLWRTALPKAATTAPGGTIMIKPHEALRRSCLTPLADAKRVWMHDPRGAVACFDHDGGPIWTQTVPAQVPHFAEGGYIAARVLPPTPPAIVGSVLLVSVGEGLAAFDLETGTQRWRRPRLDYLGQFAVMELGEATKAQLVLLSSGEVLNAATGQTLIARCAPLILDAACRPVVEGRIAYFHAASSAVRFWLDERGNVCHRLLWDSPGDIRRRQMDMNHGNHNGPGTPDFFCQGAYPPTPVIHDGLIYTHLAEPCSIERGPQNSMRCQVSDAATGCAVSQRYCVQINAMRPVTSTVMAGGMLFCADEGGKRAYNYPEFPSDPVIAVVTAEEQPRRITNDQPGLATLSPPTFDGRRVYLAGSEQIVCIERPEALGDKFSEHELAALKTGLFDKEVGATPQATTKPVAVTPVDRLPETMRPPVVPLLLGGFPHVLIGAWPLKDQPIEDPYTVMSQQSGSVVGEGAKMKLADTTAEFRAVPEDAIVAGKGIIDNTLFNMPVGTWPLGSIVPSLGVAPKVLFADAALARGLFFAVLANRRAITVALECPENARVWLSGRRINKGDRVRLVPGLYPFLVEYRASGNATPPAAPTFVQVGDPAIEMERWLARVKRNEAMLRAIADSGPAGSYAQTALDALKQ